MNRAVGEDILHDALGQFTAHLVLLQDDSYTGALPDLAPLLIRLHFHLYTLRGL